MSQVSCPSCKYSITVTARLSGKKVKCKCGATLRMPKVQSPVAVNPISAQPTGAPIRFDCPRCASTLKVNSDSAGKVARCNCGAKLRVPGTPVRNPLAAVAQPLTPTAQPITPPPPVINPPPANPHTPVPTASNPFGADPNMANPLAADPLAANTAPPLQADPYANANSFGTPDPFGASDPFAAPPLVNDDPFSNHSNDFANNGLIDASAVGFEPVASPAAGLPNLARQQPRPKMKKSGVSRKEAIARGKQRERAEATEGAGSEALYGVLMMVGAVVWFVAGLFGGVIFRYPPILFIIGLVTLVKGLMRM